MEHGLDARHAGIHRRGRPGASALAPPQDDIRPALRLDGELVLPSPLHRLPSPQHVRFGHLTVARGLVQERTGERHWEERQGSSEFELLVARFLCRQEMSTAARERGSSWLSGLLCVGFVVFVGGLLVMEE